MRKIMVIEKKAHFIIITGILILCGAFIVMSCGTDPQQKVEEFDAGQYAVDFSNCPGTLCKVTIDSDVFAHEDTKKIGDTELTAEAWVKMNSASDGTILSRMDIKNGVTLYVKAGNPTFAIRRLPRGTDPGADGCVNVHATSTECRVDSLETFGTTLTLGTWYHIAGVLVNQSHSHTASASCTAGVMAQMPHLDIYINGVFENCASANSLYADNPVQHNIYNIGILGDNASDTANLDTTIDTADEFDGVIDEARLWSVARTQGEINQCMNSELSLGGPPCGRVNSDLISYFRLNEGSGASANDWSGLGGGVLEMRLSGKLSDFTTGWTTGAPISRAD